MSLGIDCLFFGRRKTGLGEERSDSRWVFEIPVVYSWNIINSQLCSYLLPALWGIRRKIRFQAHSYPNRGSSSLPCSLSIPMLYRNLIPLDREIPCLSEYMRQWFKRVSELWTFSSSKMEMGLDLGRGSKRNHLGEIGFDTDPSSDLPFGVRGFWREEN